MVRTACVGVALLLLAGCATKPVEEMSYSQVQALRDTIAQRCVAQGVAMTAPNFQACFQHEARREVLQRENNRAAGLTIANGMQDAGATISGSY